MAGFDWIYLNARDFLELSSSVWKRASDIFMQPSVNREMLIILLPLLATMFVMQLYFSRYRKEELGWGSALGNSIVLLFVGVSLITYLLKNNLFYFIDKTGISKVKTFVVFIVLLESILLIITNFFHATPKRIAYRLSSFFLLNFIAVISVVLVYSNVPIDYITIISSILLFFIFHLFFEAIQIVIPEHLFGEFLEIKESMKNAEAQLKEVEVEKIELEEDQLEKKKEELSKEKKKINEERERIKNIEKEIKQGLRKQKKSK